MVWMECGDRLPSGIIPGPLPQQDKLPAADALAPALNPSSGVPNSAPVAATAGPAASGSDLESVCRPAAMLAHALRVWSFIPSLAAVAPCVRGYAAPS